MFGITKDMHIWFFLEIIEKRDRKKIIKGTACEVFSECSLVYLNLQLLSYYHSFCT